MVKIGTSADGMCQRKSRITSATMIISTVSSCLSVWMARVIRSERSYVVTTSTPEGIEGSRSLSLALTRSMTLRAFSPWRITTMPPT